MKHRHESMMHAFPMPSGNVQGKNYVARAAIIVGSSAALMMSSITASYAAITNSAEAVGTYNSTQYTSPADGASVPVVTATRDLTTALVVQSGPTTALGTNGTGTDGSDTITYRYTITNTGNTTEANVTPVETTNPTFNGVTGTGSFGSFTEVTGLGAGTGTAASLAPGETVVFDATYTLTDLDAFNAAGVTDGVSNTATASSTAHTDTDASSAALSTILANPALTIAKSFVLDDTNGSVANEAEVNEVITYTYTVTNSGNVALTNVSINDTHEGNLLSPGPDGEVIVTEGPVQNSVFGADDGVIDVLEAGAVATFTYVHTVTQTEVDNQ